MSKYVVRVEVRMDPRIIKDGDAYSTYLANAAGSEATTELSDAYEFELDAAKRVTRGEGMTEQGPITFYSYVVTKEEARKLDEVMSTMNRLKLWN